MLDDKNILKIDSALRQATALIWKSLPPERRDGQELQSEALRLLIHAIENFDPDADHSIYARVRERYPNTGKPWTEQSDQELRQLFESGNGVSDLSLYFQRTANGIRARLVKLGLLDPSQYRARFMAA
jgi:hypothetical protein